MKIAVLLLSFFFPFLLGSQNHDHIWLLGYSSNDVDPNWGGTIIDFSTIPPKLSYQYMDMYFFEYNASISDADGSLQFYTNGMYIANKEHNAMENGLHLNPGEVFDQMTEHGYILDQGGFAIPVPTSTSEYYLIHADREFSTPELGGHTSHLYWSKVDMSLNNGLGGVEEKNQPILEDTLGLGKIIGVRHANGRDWWLIVHEFASANYYRVLLDNEGFHVLGVASNGEGLPLLEGLGQSAFSPDGRYFSRINSINAQIGQILEIYEFDRCEGYLYNQIRIHIDNNVAAGLAISHNSRFLYVSSFLELYQYDLWAGDVEASGQLIAEYEPAWGDGPFYLAQLAPDGKIYLCTTNGVQHFHVIHQPDKPYPQCNFEQRGFPLPTYNSASMPNFPNYRLGPLDGSPCDTLGLDNVPVAKFRYEQPDSMDFLTIEFTDLSYYEPAEWSWDFGDNDTSQDTSPIHTFSQQGTYEVCLTVGNQNGEDTFCCTLELGTVSVSKQTKSIEVIVFPNPCREGVNVTISNYLPKDAKMVLFDGVGQQLKVHSLRTGRNAIRMDELRPGLYIYEVWEEDVLVKTGKLVKI